MSSLLFIRPIPQRLQTYGLLTFMVNGPKHEDPKVGPYSSFLFFFLIPRLLVLNACYNRGGGIEAMRLVQAIKINEVV